MRQYLIAFFFYFVSFYTLYAQDTINHYYYNNLKLSLLQDQNIKEIKFKEKKYINGNIKSQSMHVKIKNDELNRFWAVGKIYSYYKNGKLKGRGNIDIRTKTYRDTFFYFDKKSQIEFMSIYNNNSKYSDFSKPWFQIFNKYYTCNPDYILNIEFKKGRKFRETGFKYNNTLKY